MILADTSVWADFFRGRRPALAPELEQNRVIMHPVVIGELATGNLPDRPNTIRLLRRMPQVSVASFDECMHLLEEHRLYGSGIGWSDLQLLAAVRISSATLWTLDKPLARAAGLCGTRLY